VLDQELAMTPVSIAGIVVVALLALFIGTDPLGWSLGAGVSNFEPKLVSHPGREEFKDWPRDTESKLSKAVSIKGRDKFNGPESLAFDQDLRPFTSVADGRVIRYEGLWHGWATFAWTAKNRTELCYPKNADIPNFEVEPMCGRPLGIRFQGDISKGGYLWIADAYLGIYKMDHMGGQAELVTDTVDGEKLKFTNDIDFDQDGILYFTESSRKWMLNQAQLLVMEGDSSGRLIKYDPATKKSTVLIHNLAFANGVSVSKDGDFVVVVETITGRIWKYWLKGEKTGTKELFAQLPGMADNIRCNEQGDFWVAAPYFHRPNSQVFLYSKPWLRSLLVRLPLPKSFIWGLMDGTKKEAVAMKFSPDGKLLQVLEDQTGRFFGISDASESDGKLYLGTMYQPEISAYNLVDPGGKVIIPQKKWE
jgi:sugar lactone lactonase YvrE